MIITLSNFKESLKDFEKDYSEVIKPRCFNYIKANKKIIKRTQKLKEQKTGKDSWILCKGVRKIKTPRGNHYRVILQARYNKEEPVIMTTVYLILNDSITGQKIVYLMSGMNKIISFSSKFFIEFNEKLGLSFESFEEAVDNFMKSGKSFTIQESQTGNSNYDCQIFFKEGLVGFGSSNISSGIPKIKHFYLVSDLEKEAKENNITETSPINIYLALRYGTREENQGTLESTKNKEIEDAWKEYYEQKYD